MEVHERWSTPGWQRTSPPEGASEPDRAAFRGGLGTTTYLPITATRLEGLALRDPAPSASMLIKVLSLSVGSVDGDRAYGFRIPLVIGPLGEDARLASGDLAIERHSLTASTHSGRRLSTRTWRLVLPAATTDRRLPALGLQHIGAGLDFARGWFRITGAWRYHSEVAIGLRFDDEMPVQISASLAASRKLMGPLGLLVQGETFLLESPEGDDRLVLTAGGRLDIGSFEGVLALRALPNTAIANHLVFSATFHH